MIFVTSRMTSKPKSFSTRWTAERPSGAMLPRNQTEGYGSFSASPSAGRAKAKGKPRGNDPIAFQEEASWHMSPPSPTTNMRRCSSEREEKERDEAKARGRDLPERDSDVRSTPEAKMEKSWSAQATVGTVRAQHIFAEIVLMNTAKGVQDPAGLPREDRFTSWNHWNTTTISPRYG